VSKESELTEERKYTPEALLGVYKSSVPLALLLESSPGLVQCPQTDFVPQENNMVSATHLLMTLAAVKVAFAVRTCRVTGMRTAAPARTLTRLQPKHVIKNMKGTPHRVQVCLTGQVPFLDGF